MRVRAMQPWGCARPVSIRARCGYALQLLLASELRGANVGLIRPYVARGTRVAQKNGWLSDARHTAAIVYAADRTEDRRRAHVCAVVTVQARASELGPARRRGPE